LFDADAVGDRFSPSVEHFVQGDAKVRVGEPELEREITDLAARDDPAALERRDHFGEDCQDAVEGLSRGPHGQDPGLLDSERDPFSNDGECQCLLGWKMMVGRAAGGAGRANDVVHAGGVESLRLKGVRRSVEDAPAQRLGVVSS